MILDEATVESLGYGDTWSAMVSHALAAAPHVEAHRREQRRAYDAAYRARRRAKLGKTAGKGRHGKHVRGEAWARARRKA